jgi:hypothetical protein
MARIKAGINNTSVGSPNMIGIFSSPFSICNLIRNNHQNVHASIYNNHARFVKQFLPNCFSISYNILPDYLFPKSINEYMPFCQYISVILAHTFDSGLASVFYKAALVVHDARLYPADGLTA